MSSNTQFNEELQEDDESQEQDFIETCLQQIQKQQTRASDKLGIMILMEDMKEIKEIMEKDPTIDILNFISYVIMKDSDKMLQYFIEYYLKQANCIALNNRQLADVAKYKLRQILKESICRRCPNDQMKSILAQYIQLNDDDDDGSQDIKRDFDDSNKTINELNLEILIE